MQKYLLLRQRVEAELLPEHQLAVPPRASDQDLEAAHAPAYVDAISTGAVPAPAMRRIGFPWSTAMVERSRRSVGATIAASHDALQEGYAASLAGGTHHSYADRGEGFCVFNDIAVAIRLLQSRGAIRSAAIIDLDVHQGNGTAHIFRDDTSVFTLSVHGANNFPFHKEESDVDIGLPDRAADDEYLSAVIRGLEQLPESGDLAFYIAGADPYEGDRLGRLKVTKHALRERDRMVYDACERRGMPVVIVMGGGYAADVNDAVDVHFHAVREAASRCAVRTSR